MNTNTTDITRDQMEHAAKVLKTIAHPVKLEILQILAENEPMDVSSLCGHVGMGCQISMPTCPQRLDTSMGTWAWGVKSP